ncbi:hypothetical protein AAIG33_24780 [Phytobacter ursingii]|uniref:hypothetical protein n=1 Tax=Phytobacter ursingii TaxID=1972431 RepID=UPI0031B75757
MMTAQLPSRERLEALASGNAFTCVQDDEAAALARFALAAHEQEPYWWAIENRHGDARFVEDEHTKNNIWDEVHELNEKDDNGEYFDDNAPYKVVPVYRGPVIEAHEQEPVGTLFVKKTTYSDREIGNHFAFMHADCAMKMSAGQYPLYTHPAPVTAVPELSAVISELEKVHDWIMHTLPIPSPSTIPNAKRITGAINACRAAMLNGGKS